jgi:hypothetical protein
MADTDFAAKYMAHRAHLAAVPAALALAKRMTVDLNGADMADGEPPRSGLTCAVLRTLVAEIERLQAQVKQQQQDAAEEQREFQREARDIAAEARWQERQEHDGDFGSY